MPNLYLQQADGTPVATFKLYNDFTARAEQEEVTVIGIIPEAVSAVPMQEQAGSYTRTESPDYMDGGVTAALIEKEAEEWPLSAIDALAKMSDRVREADRMAALWKETARREFRYRVLARTGREFWRGVATKFEESRDAAKAEAAMCQTSLMGQIRRAERAEQERDDNVQSREEMINRLSTALEQARADAEQPRTLEAEQEEQIRLGRLVETICVGGGAVEVCGVTIAPTRDVQYMAERIDAPRPLAPDDVTDEMVERAWAWASRHELYGSGSVRILLEEALTPPPSRPEGAEEIEEKVATAAREAGVLLDVVDVRKFADSLAAQHVGVTGAES